MQITLETKPFAGLETDALVSYVFEGDDPIQGRIAEIDQAAGGLLKKLSKSGEFSGKPLEMTLIHAPAGLKATRLLLVGAGKREKFDVAGLRKLAGAALRYLKARSAKQIVFLVREGDSNDATAQSIVEGVVTADFETDIYKTDRKDKSVDSLVIAGYSDGERTSGEKGLSRGRIIAESQNFARELINEPSNMLTPRTLANKAAAMAKEAGLSVEILDEKKIAELKMGALLSVAQGGPEPPRVIVITYTPANAKPGDTGPWIHRQSSYVRHRRHFHQACRRHGEDEVRHGRRSRDDRHDAGPGCSQAQRESGLRRTQHGEHARRHSAEAR